MFFLKPLYESIDYVNSLNKIMCEKYGSKGMTKRSIQWISFTLTGIAITGTLCWRRFERSSAGSWSTAALSWMFRHSPSIPWQKIFIASINLILETFGITKGQLVFDDYDNHRSKKTTKIHGGHKVRNKKGGGFVNAQNIVLLILVTPVITLTVGFIFYRPDPAKKAWDKKDKKLRKKGIPKSKRPPAPPRNLAFLTKKELAAKLLRQFKYRFAHIKITAIVADSAYMSKEMRANCKRIYSTAQFISQLRKSQKVWCPKRKSISLEKYFDGMESKKSDIKLRGGMEKTIYYSSARLYVKSQRKKYHVVAFKYEGEERYRFIAASDLTWHTKDIIRTYAWRWLVEVEIEDIQTFCGYGQLSKQQGKIGAYRGMILSLLFSHFLLQHPRQMALHRARQPLATVGSLRNSLQLDSFRQAITQALDSPDPKAFLKEWVDDVDELIELRPSRKHMLGHEIEEIRGSPSLFQRFRKTA